LAPEEFLHTEEVVGMFLEYMKELTNTMTESENKDAVITVPPYAGFSYR